MEKKGQELWVSRAAEVLPAGGFGNFDPSIIIKKGKGARVWDEDGNEYVDFLIGSGPMILGHGHPEVIEAVTEQLAKGMTFFATNSQAIELAEEIFHVPVRLGAPQGVAGMGDVISNPIHATGVGLLHYGFGRQRDFRRSGSAAGAGIFARLKAWLESNF